MRSKRNDELATRKTGSLLRSAPDAVTVGALEQALLAVYPASDAEAWDRTGLSVGDPALAVDGVAIALDPTVESVKQARSVGANVLVTHHPAFLEAPDSFRPLSARSSATGSVVWEAISQGVAIMSFHTALDVSQDAARVLPGMLGLVYQGPLRPLEGSQEKGYGQICSIRDSDRPFSLGRLAARCTSVFARSPRVWGDFSRVLTSIATCSGSAGEFGADCLVKQIDCLVCGEIKYHDALALSQAGLAIVELGHDISELPYAAPLASSVERAGIARSNITVLDQSRNWAYPETTRL